MGVFVAHGPEPVILAANQQVVEPPDQREKVRHLVATVILQRWALPRHKGRVALGGRGVWQAQEGNSPTRLPFLTCPVWALILISFCFLRLPQESPALSATIRATKRKQLPSLLLGMALPVSSFLHTSLLW